MYKIKVESDFSAAHNLRGYKGKCEELHGHNWKVEAEVKAKILDKDGLALDFKILKERLNSVLEVLDHKYLNEVPYFKKNNPTSENIAKYIYDKLAAYNLQLTAVTVWESENCAATYEKG